MLLSDGDGWHIQASVRDIVLYSCLNMLKKNCFDLLVVWLMNKMQHSLLTLQ
ncbi:hypothetical protein PPTG_24047 [Phytophthora nicotianae INRA-310]|uniref:Uncharacterized protein n=1 Tax=Phytophthora nicotianae (strain INRA-310) TaxID=761204 RepID=W2PKV3_PHYN3|nr:hypothetical protein PPTG_24047 [Phytophthora nicotianae INRA-310]ETN01487.1 hypothetical protein PPTG_24047 [Phytophthora nicotianae INRA-310]